MDWWHNHANQLHDGTIRFDLFVRTLGAPAGSHHRQSSVFDRIDRLDHCDAIDSVRITVWGDCVCVSECCANNPAVRSVRDRIQQFREWCREKPTVTASFERREIQSSITGEEYAVVDLPTICLAVYVDAHLEAVVPATIDGETWTVPTYLDSFERVRETNDSAVVVDA